MPYWTPVIPFPLADPVRVTEAPDFNTVKERDLGKFLSQNQTYHKRRLYMDPKKYDISDAMSWDRLLNDIQTAAANQSCGLVRNGTHNNKGQKSYRLSCCYGKKYERKKPLAGTTKRQRNSKHERDEHHVCPFSMSVQCDTTFGYYIYITSRTKGQHDCKRDGNFHVRAREGKQLIKAKKKKSQAAAARANNNNNNNQTREKLGTENVQILARHTLSPLVDEMMTIIKEDEDFLGFFAEKMAELVQKGKREIQRRKRGETNTLGGLS